MKSPLLDSEVVHDILGIGFGPSNLALSIAVEEHNRSLPADRRLNALFLERQPRFGWHRGMLIDDATMQVSFLKDLVTLRNPTSDYSFLCFLREQGRLIDFLNQKTLFPLRVEFHEYFEWAAARVSHLVSYGSEVVSVDPVRGDDGEIAYFDVTSRGPSGSGTTITRRARNISVAMGLEPHVPPGLELAERIWHNSELIPGRPDSPTRAGPCGGPWCSAPGRAPPRRWTTCTAPSRPPRCARCSPSTATPRPTTARSRTASSTRRRWTSTSRPRPR